MIYLYICFVCISNCIFSVFFLINGKNVVELGGSSVQGMRVAGKKFEFVQLVKHVFVSTIQ